jgi:DNA-binding NarL/FixJ family response regulator
VGTGVIRVAVVDDHPVFRQGLAHAVEAADDFELVAAVASVEDLAATGAADLVILDLGLPGTHGPDAVRQVCERGSTVLVVSAGADQKDVLSAMAAGASGYLTKSAEPDEITAAARIVAAGGTYVSSTLAAYLLRAANADNRSGPQALTKREREILALVAAGERDTDIAEQLYISIRTVRSHLDRIRDKTGYRRRADLTRLALQEGVIEPGPDPD